METYSIKQVSELIKIPKDTLRYYDKIGLICAKLLDLFNKKKLELIKKQNLFGSMIEFMTQIKTLMDQKKDCEDIVKIDKLVENIFEELGERKNEE